jgi:predicted nucleotidyltransferase
VRRSCGSSRVTYLDRERAVEQLRLLAGELVASNAEVIEVRLFGSLARMESVPGSDADLFILLRRDESPRWFDRIPRFSAAFADTDMPVEVFPYTLDEVDRLEQSGSGLLRAARSGILLAARSQAGPPWRDAIPPEGPSGRPFSFP